MPPKKVLDYLGNSLRQHGVAATLHDLGCRAINKVVQFQILEGMTVRVPDVTDPGFFDAQGLDARFAGEAELERYVRVSGHGIDQEFLRKARARGDRCYALFDGDTLASYGWYSELPTALDEHFVLHFARGWTYMYKGYTLPAYRGRRLHAVGMCRALRAFTDEGRKGLVSCVASNNFASLRSVMRMGYRIFGAAYLLRVGDGVFTGAWSTPGCRDYGFRVEAMRAGALLGHGA